MKTLHFSTEGVYSEKIAYSYIRWSSVIQGAGDSLRRQKHLAEQWCQRNGVKLADDKIMVDAGVSAYHGKNLAEGAMGAFVTAAKEGKIVKGSYLLVEALDRLSRMRTVEVLSVFLEILKAGIVLVTLGEESERVFRWEDIIERDLEDAIDEMRASHRFSQKLSRRVKDSWIGRTKTARDTGKPIPGNLPAWLYYDANGDLQIDEAKAEIVRRIFDMCISGMGLNVIAQTLNRAGVPPLGLAKRKTIKNRSNFWTVTSVAYLLRYKAVFGEYHRKTGEVLTGIFPVIVSKDDFYRAEAARATRLTVAKGRNGKAYTNLFKGIAICHDCGEPMNIRNNTNKRLQFRCKGVPVKTCNAKPWNYQVFEDAFLNFVKEIDLNAIMHGGSESKLAEITRQLQSLDGERLSLVKLEETYLTAIDKNEKLEPIYQGRVLANRQKMDAIAVQVKVLEAERNQIQVERRASNELLPAELPRDIKVRAKVAEHIRTIVEWVTLKRDPSSKFGSNFMVQFKGGDSRLVHVDYTNPRKPFAITNGVNSDKPNVIPEDSETAFEMAKYMMKAVFDGAKWLAENGRVDDANETMEKLKSLMIPSVAGVAKRWSQGTIK
ncbi:recombinase family protein [Mesorhizobium sp. C416B]|uniref:recombinase family protein n=1 Tax=unclassified Mesorhizobium TaxID=325217 RepID=UPI000A058A48|nr:MULTISPECIES: recombinase family protein [unclassified Mesorhizobium]WJI64501.1 recombinase family protein [Mesorhizobium sp. C416B]